MATINLAIAIHKSQPVETNAKLSIKGKKKFSIRVVFYISVNIFNTKYVAYHCMHCICGQWHWKQNKTHETGSRADKYSNTRITSVTHLFSWLIILCKSHRFTYYFKIKFIWQIACVHGVIHQKKKSSSPFPHFFLCQNVEKNPFFSSSRLLGKLPSTDVIA